MIHTEKYSVKSDLKKIDFFRDYVILMISAWKKYGKLKKRY